MIGFVIRSIVFSAGVKDRDDLYYFYEQNMKKNIIIRPKYCCLCTWSCLS